MKPLIIASSILLLAFIIPEFPATAHNFEPIEQLARTGKPQGRQGAGTR